MNHVWLVSDYVPISSDALSTLPSLSHFTAWCYVIRENFQLLSESATALNWKPCSKDRQFLNFIKYLLGWDERLICHRVVRKSHQAFITRCYKDNLLKQDLLMSNYSPMFSNTNWKIRNRQWIQFYRENASVVNLYLCFLITQSFYTGYSRTLSIRLWTRTET